MSIAAEPAHAVREQFMRVAIEQARRSIEVEKRAALADLRNQVADLAVQAAGSLLDANIDNEKNRQLVDDLISQIPESSSQNN